MPETISFTAADGWPLEGELYTGTPPRIAVLISAGTGFPRSFYRHIAQYLAQRGAAVLTYDYRGIGGSFTTHERFMQIDYADWGRFDTPASIDALEAHAPGVPLVHIAHSVGGHFLGLHHNHRKIARHAFVSVGTGYFGRHHLRYRPLEIYFWWIFGTYMLTRVGYIAAQSGWRGAPLPPKLFRTWRRWAHRPAYLAPELHTTLAPSHYDQVSAPIRSWIFSDDPIATRASGQDLLDVYSAAPTEVAYRTPADLGVAKIGHDGAFRKGQDRLWAELWDWLSDAVETEQGTEL